MIEHARFDDAPMGFQNEAEADGLDLSLTFSASQFSFPLPIFISKQIFNRVDVLKLLSLTISCQNTNGQGRHGINIKSQFVH